jgi:hypothetical protein
MPPVAHISHLSYHRVYLCDRKIHIRSEKDLLMKRSLILLVLVTLFAAACGTAESDDPDLSVNETPAVTVFRSPT